MPRKPLYNKFVRKHVKEDFDVYKVKLYVPKKYSLLVKYLMQEGYFGSLLVLLLNRFFSVEASELLRVLESSEGEEKGVIDIKAFPEGLKFIENLRDLFYGEKILQVSLCSVNDLLKSHQKKEQKLVYQDLLRQEEIKDEHNVYYNRKLKRVELEEDNVSLVKTGVANRINEVGKTGKIEKVGQINAGESKTFISKQAKFLELEHVDSSQQGNEAEDKDLSWIELDDFLLK